mmetsp:Transcript_4660/g.8132  ORF Transcript_4660/g.8132 Transcript_4660/m.8132 type:complete len:92 (-) Transcript_4660:145-420(-)
MCTRNNRADKILEDSARPSIRLTQQNRQNKTTTNDGSEFTDSVQLASDEHWMYRMVEFDKIFEEKNELANDQSGQRIRIIFRYVVCMNWSG